jgi:hypothetical protein
MLRNRDGWGIVLLLLGRWSGSVGGDSSWRVDGVLRNRLRWGRIPGEMSNVDRRKLLLPGLFNILA